jgi:catechol 2,3-dioxygenase-like lactoylglutathione lyase family enzyme
MAVEERFTHPANGTRIVLLRGAGGVRLELIELLGSEPDPNAATNPDESLMWHGYGHLAFRVAGIEGAFAALLAAGAGSVREPGPSFVPGARYAYVADPEGNQIEIVERAGGE